MDLGSTNQIVKGVASLWKAGRNVRVHDIKLQRATRDHDLWIEHRDVVLREELARIDNDLAERNLLQSGIRVGANDRAKAAALRELRSHQSALADLREDVMNDESWIERLYRKLKKKPLLDPSKSQLENQVEQRWLST